MKRIIVVSSFSVPLILIFISALLSPWFDPFSNALSDLGHATKSEVAPLFNFGLACGGFLATIASIKYLIRRNEILGLNVACSGFLLTLIGVFDEVYGFLHFFVSVAFFLSLLAFLVAYWIYYKRSKLLLLSVSLALFTWYLHFGPKMIKGAAIPELVSIFLFLPYYVELFFQPSTAR